MNDNAALPTMFRTLSALKDTEQHLLDYLDSDDPRLGLGRVSMYMWDRQRSIRQDMAWQKMEVMSFALLLSSCSQQSTLKAVCCRSLAGRLHDTAQ